MSEEHNIELHPAMVVVVLTSYVNSAEANDEQASVVRLGIERYVNLNLEELGDILARDDPAPAVPEDLPEDSDDLIVEYFRCLEELGTFRRDRSAYENDDQRLLHDRIVALYHRIAGE